MNGAHAALYIAAVRWQATARVRAASRYALLYRGVIYQIIRPSERPRALISYILMWCTSLCLLPHALTYEKKKNTFDGGHFLVFVISLQVRTWSTCFLHGSVWYPDFTAASKFIFVTFLGHAITALSLSCLSPGYITWACVASNLGSKAHICLPLYYFDPDILFQVVGTQTQTIAGCTL